MPMYSESDLKSLVEYLKEFDFKYEPIYTIFEDWLNDPTPDWDIESELKTHFPTIYYVMFKVSFEGLSRYTKESHEGPVAAWRLVREVKDELYLKECERLS